MPKLQFKIEQIAINPKLSEGALKLLSDMGATEWIEDTVCGDVVVQRMNSEEAEFGESKGKLLFNYDMGGGGGSSLEFEILEYKDGPNWLSDRTESSVSHLGMHVNEEELERWIEFFCARGIKIVQRMLTTSHTNSHIAGKRWYEYVIFGTQHILGVDVKFIVRKENAPK